MHNLQRYLGFAIFCITVTCILLYNTYAFIGEDFYWIHLINYLLIPFITAYYLLYKKIKEKLFSLFLISYSLANIIGLVADIIIVYKYLELMQVDVYIVNGLYLISYIFLILIIIKSLNFSILIKDFKIYLIVLSILDIYLVYFILKLISASYINISMFILEFMYNTVLVLLLSLSALRYFYNDDKKALYLFIGALLIIFAEVASIAFIYIENRVFLRLAPIVLATLAFYFFFQQSKLLDTTKE